MTHLTNPIRTESKKFIEVDNRNHAHTILISILSTVETPLSQEVKDRYLDVLELRFDDIVEEQEGLSLFNFRHVKEIQHFVNKHIIGDIVVHCSQGVSRSTAVALAICIYIKKNNNMLVETIRYSDKMNPNEHVTNVFKDVFEHGRDYRDNPSYDYDDLKDHMVVLLASSSNLILESSWKKQISETHFIIGIGSTGLDDSMFEWYKKKGYNHKTYKLEMMYFDLFMCKELLDFPREWDGEVSTLRENTEGFLRNLNFPKGVSI